MIKYFIIILGLFFLQNNFLFSENWEPFPIHQTSFYKITEVKTPWLINYEDNDLIGAVTIIKFDSSLQVNNENLKFFSQILHNSDNCILQKKDSLTDKFDKFPNLIPESYIIKADTLIFMVKNEEDIKNYCFKIPLYLNYNDTFFNSYFDSTYKYSMKTEMKLISKVERIIFGISDSIMTFQIQKRRLPDKQDGTYYIELSKKFGFIKFFPLDILFPWSLSSDIQQLELMSATNNSKHYGETYDFQYRKRDYLEKQGDIKIFKEIWGDLGDTDYAFIRDSIIGTDVSGDVVFVVYNRKTISTNQGEYPDSDKIDSYSYFKKDSIIYSGYNAMVDALKRGETFIPSTKLFDKVPNKETKVDNDSLEVIATPLLFKFVERCGEKELQLFYNYQGHLDRAICNIQTHYYLYRILDKTTDLWWEHGQNDQTFEGNHVVGYKNGDCEWGDLTWPPKGVSVNENPRKEFLIFPNPTSEKLTLSQIPEGAMSFEIFDYLGIKRSDGHLDKEIDVTFLASGIYFLKFNNQPPLKFIKL